MEQEEQQFLTELKRVYAHCVQILGEWIGE